MNKIIPFNKEIKFDDNIGEIINIALDDNLKFKDNQTINGELVIKGSHKYGDIEEDFSYPIPTIISVDNKYDTSEAKIVIDDFYYEIINDNTLKVKIDLILENLSFKENKQEKVVEEIIVKDDEEQNISNIFNETSQEKEYSVYRVYVVKEGDTLNKILEDFSITSEELSYYNDYDSIKPGMKLIIPSVNE